MGIIIGDSIQSVSNSYCSIANSHVQIYKNPDGTFVCNGIGTIWTNQSARNSNNTPISSVGVVITINSSELTSNLYSKLYTQLKTNFSSTTDAI
jgi:hypothetical protein